jgi:hypothetical protein
MATRLWARWDEREDGTSALTFFRRVVVETPRGQALEDIPVISVEDPKGKIKELPEMVELELDVQLESAGTIAIIAQAKGTEKKPKDPTIKRTKFDDPETDEAKERKKKAARGMGRFRGGKEAKPASKGTAPPVPPEQRAGGRGSVRGRRKKGAGKKTIKRGASVRGAPRAGGKKT